jgi:hypothetical protein
MGLSEVDEQQRQRLDEFRARALAMVSRERLASAKAPRVGRVPSSMKETSASSHGGHLGSERGAALHQKWVVVTSHLFGVESHGVVRRGGSIKWAAVG